MKHKRTRAAALLGAGILLFPLLTGSVLNVRAEDQSETEETDITVIDTLHLDDLPLPEAGTTVEESINKIKSETKIDNQVEIDWVSWYKGECTLESSLEIDRPELRGETLFHEGYTYTCWMRLDVDYHVYDTVRFAFEKKLDPSPV